MSSARMQSSLLHGACSAVVGEGGELCWGNATVLGFNTHSSGKCCEEMEVLVVGLEPKIMVASKGVVANEQ